MCAMNPRLLRPKASGFNPASISGIANWWDANDAATVTLNAGAVETWTSKAGLKSAASQSTANNRPVTTTVNGKTALSFDGSNDGLNFTGTSRTDETWIIAAAQTADQSGQRQMLSDGSAGTGMSATKGAVKFFEVAFGGFTEGTNRLRPQYSATASALMGPGVFTCVRSAAAGGFVFIDGTQRIGAVSPFASSFSTSNADTMSKIGYYSSSLFQFQGWIGEILCYSRALTSAERNAVELYLGRKWGIAVTQVPSVSNADAQDWVNRVYAAGSTVSQPVANAVSAFVAGCQADGIWDAMKSVVLLAGADTLAGALVPLKGAAPTNNNFVAGDYTRTTGLLGNVTTKFLDTNRAGNADPQDSFHAAVYASTVASGGVRVYSGSGLNASGSFNFFVDGGTAITFRNRTAGSSSFAGGASATGLIGTSRASSASYVSRAGGTSQTNTVASETPVSQNIFMYALNNSGASFHANARLAFYSIGESIDLALLDARVTALVTAIGAS